MHDIKFAKTIADNIISISEKDKEIMEVTIELGELSGIHDHDLLHALERITPYHYKLINKKSIVSCDCGFTGSPKIDQILHDSVVFSCPQCSEIPKILEGDKIKILKIIYK